MCLCTHRRGHKRCHCSYALYIFSYGSAQNAKNDNGPAYVSHRFKQFCSQFQIKHITGIPYKTQGQGIVEQAHQTLKNTLLKLTAQETIYSLKGSAKFLLSHALFVLNFLTSDNQGSSAADRLWHISTNMDHAHVLWKDPLTGQWQGPDPMIVWGKGSTCIYDSKEGGARWLSERLIKLYNKFQANSNINKAS